jgi:hypothetical protein
MHDLTAAPPVPPTTTAPRTVGRWMLTFVGFPIGGLTASFVAGPIDSAGAALLGGALTGAILGAVQAWGLGRRRPPAAQWILATALGMAFGLALGAAAVDYQTGLSALALQGAVCGAAVGIGQALILRARLGLLVLAWPPVLGLIWALGWAITTAIGVEVDEQFTVFGSSGAVVVTALTLILPLTLHRTEGTIS